jgi:periplasmic protein TonB
MSLQHYRSQLAARQNRRLMFYLSLAVGVHAAGLWLAHSEQWLNPKMPQPPTPIEFVTVQPNQTPQPPQPTERRAQADAIANQNPDTEQTPQTGRTETSSAALPPLLPSSGTSSRPQPTPLPPLLPAPTPQPPLQQMPQSEPVAPIETSPSPRSASPIPNLPSPRLPSQSPSPAANSPSAASPPASDLATRSNQPSAAQLGSPLTASASLEGQGQTGQLNPNRSGNGASVDAIADDVWGDYLSILNQAIDQNWRRISVPDTRRTRLRFRVDRQGNLRDLHLVQPSGDALADETALQAVRAAAPFAPLPPNASEQVLIVNFTFTHWK